MNPFRYGQIVTSGDFCPRPLLLKQLMAFAESGQNVFVQGERRTGKTSLIHETVKKLKGYRLLYIDLLEIKTTEDLCRRMITAIVRLEDKASFQRKIFSTLSHLRPSLTVDPLTGFPSMSFDFQRRMKPETIEGILDLMGEIGSRRKLVVVFDEFQDILNLKNSSGEIALLRSRIQFQNSIPFIFAGSVRNSMCEIFTDPSSPFFKSAASLEVGTIDEKAFVPFLKRKFSSGCREVSKVLIVRAMEISGNIPGDVQEFCACVWDVTSNGEEVTGEHLDAALEMIFAREKKAYEAILSNITGQQLRCAAAMAANGELGLLSKEFMEASGIRTASSVQAAVRRLVKLKVIYRYEGTYRLANPFFGSWLIWNGY